MGFSVWSLDSTRHAFDKEVFGYIIIFHLFDQVKENGLEDNVMTVEEIRSGPECRGSGIFPLYLKVSEF